MLPVLTPSEFVALANQTFEIAMPVVEIEGEVTNFKISKGRWVYFDLADDEAKLRSFGTVYLLPGPVEDGMRIRVICTPRLHPQFGFSLNVQSLQFSGEGTIKKAADLLQAKLEKEGLFALERKRVIPFPPARIALITSAESAAYKDFIKVLGARYGGVGIELADVTVQGESAPGQIVRAIDWFNKQAELADVLVIIRGGGSADDLQAFSSEHVTRAVAASRIPTMVAIGHEVDVSLAELAADVRASTPSNAAELLVPDRRELIARAEDLRQLLVKAADTLLEQKRQELELIIKDLHEQPGRLAGEFNDRVQHLSRTLTALSPQATLKRGYAIVRKEGKAVSSVELLAKHDRISLQLSDGEAKAEVQ